MHRAAEYARQVAAGLAAAHDKGIVHRDLKPENLFVTDDGLVKILDFGVAKLRAAPDTGGDAAQDSTAPAQTGEGSWSARPATWRPSRCAAQAVDARSDIFSLGAILYEMLAGRRAFHAATPIDTALSVLKDEPSAAASGIPPALERLVARCLDKNPAQRFQSARDLAFALEAYTLPQPAAAPPPRPSPPARTRWFLLAGVAAAGLLVGLLRGPLLAPSAPEESTSYRRLTFRQGAVGEARFAPDGQAIYDARWADQAGRSEIFSVRPDGPESRSLGLAGSAVLAAVSRNGEIAVLLEPRRIANGTAGTLARVPLAGGAPREVLRDVEAADFAPDGAELAIVRSVNGKDRLEFPVGNVLYETSGGVARPRFSPDGEHIAFVHFAVPNDDRGNVVVVDRAGHARDLTKLWASVSGLAWSPRGEVWFTAAEVGADADLHAVTLDGRERVVERVPGRLTIHDVAADGRALLSRATARWAIVVLAPGETHERDLSWFDWPYVADFAADGRTVLFTESGQAVGVNYRAYLRRTDGSEPVWLGRGSMGALSPDGKWTVLAQIDRPEVFQLVPTGPGEARELPSGTVTKRTRPGWFPDGKRLVFSGVEASAGWRVYVQDLDGLPRVISGEGLRLDTSHAVSPDGRHVLALDASQMPVVLSVVDGSVTPIPGIQSGERVPQWANDEKVYVFQSTRIPCQIWRVDVATGRRTLVREIVPTVVAPNGVRELLLTADASAYAYGVNATVSDLYLLAPAPRR